MTLELHCHSNASDGARSPEELTAAAAAAGIQILALTDHDTLKNTGPMAELCRAAGIHFLPGIELSCWNGLESIHILGYFQNGSSPGDELNHILASFQEKRVQRAHAMVHRLKLHYGIDLDLDQLPTRPGASIGRANLAQLIQSQHNISREEIFRRFLGDHSKAFIPSSDMKPQDGLHLLHDAGAVAILAHPGELRQTRFTELFGLEFDGAECYYPKHTPQRTREFVRACLERGRLMTCGSDDHGLTDDRKHGTLGSTPCPFDHVRPFLEQMNCPLEDLTLRR